LTGRTLGSARSATAVRTLGRWLEAAAIVVLAPRCAICGAALQQVHAAPVCPACWGAIRVFTPPVCRVCGDPLGWGARDLCDTCRRTPRGVERGAAIGPYEGTLRDVVHVLKYGGRRSLAGELARLMKACGGGVLGGADVLVPVPLHWRRRHARGFNQAEALARGLDLPLCDALSRCRSTRSQIGLSASERRQNVRGAFRLAGHTRRGRARRRRAIAGKVVVVIDDVSTTGATIEACAEVLKAEGAREVRALTAARTVTTPGR
jgi:ComF family protein